MHDLELGELTLPPPTSSAFHSRTDLQILLSSCYSAAQNPSGASPAYRCEILLLHLVLSAPQKAAKVFSQLHLLCLAPGSAVLHIHLLSTHDALCPCHSTCLGSCPSKTTTQMPLSQRFLLILHSHHPQLCLCPVEIIHRTSSDSSQGVASYLTLHLFESISFWAQRSCLDP